MLKALEIIKKWAIHLRAREGLTSVGSFDPHAYWETRAKRHGPRAVLNLGHKKSEVAFVTEWQKGILFPALASALGHPERLALDFGCGPGRFTNALAEMISGKAIGVDISQTLLSHTEKTRNVEFRLIAAGAPIEFPETFDLIFCCLTLGGIPDRSLPSVCQDLLKALKPEGLVFLVENTQPNRPSLGYWHYRSVQDYQSLFPEIDLKPVHEYFDLEERITLMAGRRKCHPQTEAEETFE